MALSSLSRRLVSITLTTLIAALIAACTGEAPRTEVPTEEPRATSTPRTGDTGTRARTTPAPAPTEAPATSEAKLVAATLTRAVNDDQQPTDPTENFYPGETVYLSLEFEGRPEQGVVSAEFFWGEESLASAEIDFADVNSGVIFSFGQSTFTTFNLTTDRPLPVSGNYRVVTKLDGEEIGEYPFGVIQPEGSLPSQIAEVVLAKGHDNYTPQDVTSTFAPEETVFLVGRGDLGIGAWMRAEVYQDGSLVEDLIVELGPMEQDMADTGFAFDFVPDNAWPESEYEVVLYLNDEKVDSYGFTIGAAAAPDAPAVASGIEIGELETFSPESGLFSIDVPSNWTMQDNSSSLTASYVWQDPSGMAGLVISIYETQETKTEQLLTDEVTEFVTSSFGESPGFTILETTPQPDGSVLVAWNIDSETNGQPNKALGLSYIQQNEDKVTLMIVVMPDAESEALWEGGLSRVVNSYQIDPSVKINQ